MSDYRIINKNNGMFAVQEEGSENGGAYWTTVTHDGLIGYFFDREFKTIEKAKQYITTITTPSYIVVKE